MGRFGVFKPPPEIPKALHNRAKLNPICENCYKLLNLGRQHPKMFRKKAVKFQNYLGSQLFYISNDK